MAKSPKKKADPQNEIMPTDKTTGIGTGMYKKTEEVLKKVDQGYSIKDAHKIVTGNNNLSTHQEKRIKKKYEKWSLMRPKRKNKVAKATDKILDDFLAGDRPEYATHVREFQKEIDARDNPVVKHNMNMNMNHSFIDINLSEYK